jgi:hypothetical protein
VAFRPCLAEGLALSVISHDVIHGVQQLPVCFVMSRKPSVIVKYLIGLSQIPQNSNQR